MAFILDFLSQPVRDLLDKDVRRAMPLTRTGKCDRQEAAELEAARAAMLFPGARAPGAALSGLLLLLDCWDQSHEVSQDLSSREGDYWHAIAHRTEPDAANAGYWFRCVGEHPIFPELHRRAAEILAQSGAPDWRLQAVWDPYLFIKWCDEARKAPGSDRERAALEIQRAEWELLFEWCARGPA